MKKVLQFLSVLDREGNLSLTNLFLLGSSILFVIQGADPQDSAPLLLASLNYAHKRYQQGKSFDKESLQELQSQLEEVKRSNDQVADLAKTAHQLASKASLKLGFDSPR